MRVEYSRLSIQLDLRLAWGFLTSFKIPTEDAFLDTLFPQTVLTLLKHQHSNPSLTLTSQNRKCSILFSLFYMVLHRSNLYYKIPFTTIYLKPSHHFSSLLKWISYIAPGGFSFLWQSIHHLKLDWTDDKDQLCKVFLGNTWLCMSILMYRLPFW